MSDWRHHAACAQPGEDPETWFPTGIAGPALDQTARAQAVCRRCPVRPACLEHALREGLDHGIWGGLTEDQRRGLARPRPKRGQVNEDRVTALMEGRDLTARITTAERHEAIQRLTAAGMSARQIAERLDMTKWAVEAARTRIRKQALTQEHAA